MKSIRFRAVVLTAVSLLPLVGCGWRSGAQNAVVTIKCDAPRLAPEELASEVSHPLELQLQGLPLVESVRSTSREGRAVIWVEFARGADRMEARQAVAERISAIEQLLPEGVAVLLAPEASPRDVNFLMALSMPESRAVDEEMQAVLLRTVAEDSLRPKLVAVPGVADVKVIGGMRKQIQIDIDPERLAAYDLTLVEFADAVEHGLGAAPSETLVFDGVNLAADEPGVEAIANLPVRVREGRPVYVRDVAEVKIGGARADELPPDPRRPQVDPSAVMLVVRVQADANLGGVSGQINLILAELRPRLAPGVRLERKVPSRLNQHVLQTLANLERDLPPEVKLEHLRTKEFGSVVRRATPWPIAVKALGSDMADVQAVCRKVETKISEMSGITNVHVKPQLAPPQAEILIDRERLSALDVETVSVAAALEIALGGRVVGQVKEVDQRVDVVVRLDETIDNDFSQLGEIRLRSSTGEQVPLSDVTKMRMTTRVAEVYRENGLFLSLVLCGAGDRDREEVLTEIQQRLSASLGNLPAGVVIEYR